MRSQDSYGASLIAQLVKNLPAMQETLVRFLGREDPSKRDRLPTPVFLGFPCDSAGKESTCNVGDLGSIPGLGRSPGEGKGYPLQYSGLEKSMDCIVYGVARSQTQLSDSLSLHRMLINLEGRTEMQTVNHRPCWCTGGAPWGLTVEADSASGWGLQRGS